MEQGAVQQVVSSFGIFNGPAADVSGEERSAANWNRKRGGGGENQRGEKPLMYFFNALLDGERLNPCTRILIQFRFHLV